MKRAEIERQFDQIVAFAEVEKFIDTPVKHFPSGMYLRLAFAVAAHLDPEILIVDEVLAVGDGQFQKKCLGKMGDVAKAGRTVLFVSHNMVAVRSLCTTSVLIVNGQVACRGRPDETIAEYLDTAASAQRGREPLVHHNPELGVTLSRVELLNGAGEVVSALETGQPAALRMLLSTQHPWNNVTAAFGVNSLLDNYRVGVLSSSVSGNDLSIQPPQTHLVCHLPKVPLMPGRYRLTLMATAGHRTLFYLPEAMDVDVVAGDFFGSGKLPESSWGGPCLIEHRWASALAGSPASGDAR